MFEGLLDPEKLTAARRLFEESLETWNPWFRNLREDFRFASGGKNQWESQDLQLLRDQNRPALTFNLVGVVINEMIGANQDAKRDAKVVPVGPEDQPKAEILNRLADAIRRTTDEDAADCEAFERGIIGGIAHTNIDAAPDPRNPVKIRITIEPVHPFEIVMDPASKRRDMGDSDFIFWSRWVRIADFKEEFPKHAKEVDELVHLIDVQGFNSPNEMPDNSMTTFGSAFSLEAVGALEDDRYYDRRRRRIRVIHLEYRQPVKKFFGINPSTRRADELSSENFHRVRSQNIPLQTTTTWDEEFRWLEFTGLNILFDGLSPVPIKGFTVKQFVCARDHLTGEPRGLVRDLVDPQREINKRHSQTLHLLNQQGAPGTIAETGAWVDRTQAETAMRTPGASAEATTGALAANRIMFVKPPVFPTASAEMMKTALEMFFRISGVHIDTLVGQRSGNEAPTTALLRHRRSIMAITKVLQNFQAYQKSMLNGKLQLISNLLPDEQIQAMLGDPSRWQVRGGVVNDAQTGGQVNLRDIEDLDWDIELDVAAASTTIAILQLQIMLSMQQFGIPMEPETMIEQLALSRDKKLKLQAYARGVQESGAKSAQAAQATEMQKTQAELAIKQAETQLMAMSDQEKGRHNAELEMIAMLKSERDFMAKLSAIYEKADTQEKAQIFGVLKTIMDLAERQEEARLAPPVAA